MKHTTILLVAGLCVLASAPGAANGQDQGQAIGPVQPGQIGFDQNIGVRVPLDLPFRDDHGRELRLGDLFGKRPVVLAMVYYQCPLLCNQVLNGLSQALKAMKETTGKDFDLVAVSIDPKETVELAGRKKEGYLGRYDRPGSEDGWHFLVGDAKPIEELARAVGFRYQYNPRTELFAHAAGILVLTPDGRISRYFFGIEYPYKELQREIGRAATGQVGTPIVRLLLLCYDYDAATGKYTLAIVRLMRILGTLTAAALGTYLFLTYWRGHVGRAAPEPQHAGPGGSPADAVD